MTRPTAPVARRQVSVHELIQRVRAENSPPPVADRVEHRVRASVALEKGLPHPDRLMRWLVAGAGVVTALSAFTLISFVVQNDPAPPVRAPEVPGPITFAGTRTVTETADPPPAIVFHPPYGSQYGSYYVPSK
ncbi:hypothetical protein [Amycolatopsis sp. lyj-109]|uniref:hypothetical protein n=1 Tax=Amycolatopsis sp. lyj-109 TaxID=2789287 RepID=UPI00397AC722